MLDLDAGKVDQYTYWIIPVPAPTEFLKRLLHGLS